MVKKPDRQNICNAGEYYIASILSANGFTVTLTLGRAEKYDIIAINPNGKSIKLQVKTLYGDWIQWRMSPKNEKVGDKDLFYAFVRLNDLKKEPEYWVVPSNVVAKYIKCTHSKWLATPRRDGTPHPKDYSGRAFRVKSDRNTPKDWTEHCKQFKSNIKQLLK